MPYSHHLASGQGTCGASGGKGQTDVEIFCQAHLSATTPCCIEANKRAHAVFCRFASTQTGRTVRGKQGRRKRWVCDCDARLCSCACTVSHQRDDNCTKGRGSWLICLSCLVSAGAPKEKATSHVTKALRRVPWVLGIFTAMSTAKDTWCFSRRIQAPQQLCSTVRDGDPLLQC